MAKTPIDKEVDKRADYFAEQVEDLTDERDEVLVVNEKTAKEFIAKAFGSDASLSNLLEAMQSTGQGWDSIIKTPYIQGLIERNNSLVDSEKNLEKGVQKLRKKRESLEKMIPKKQGVVRKKVINKFTTATVLKKYSIKKDDNGRYRDSKNGRYVSYDRILKITDVVILNTAAKRRELERFMANIKK